MITIKPGHTFEFRYKGDYYKASAIEGNKYHLDLIYPDYLKELLMPCVGGTLTTYSFELRIRFGSMLFLHVLPLCDIKIVSQYITDYQYYKRQFLKPSDNSSLHIA